VLTKSCSVRRKNMWICALKQALKDVKIFGPGGDPGAAAGVTQVTMVPYEPPAPEPVHLAPSMPEPLIPRGNFNLTDKNAVFADDSLDVYDERDELRMTNPRPTMPRPRVGGPPMPDVPPSGQVPRTQGVTTPHGEYETIELDTRPVQGSSGQRL